MGLSYTLILHQTTTDIRAIRWQNSCLISLFYIKPQHAGDNRKFTFSCLISLFYIKPQPCCSCYLLFLCCLISLFYIKPQLHDGLRHFCLGCLISLFYIKPQHVCQYTACVSVVLYPYSTSNHNRSPLHRLLTPRCLISLFYIKPQLRTNNQCMDCSCLISLFYIKPQHMSRRGVSDSVVLYPYSTSNHNNCFTVRSSTAVVLYPYSTSNHNSDAGVVEEVRLSYILILHQTTTCGECDECRKRCLISLFYIKPQLITQYFKCNLVVLYPYSTSNHNSTAVTVNAAELSYILILHQTTTAQVARITSARCLISLFYIKPQPRNRS